MSEIDRLLELHAQIDYSDRVTMDSSPKDIQERDALKLKCSYALKLQELVKEEIEELKQHIQSTKHGIKINSDVHTELRKRLEIRLTKLQSLVEESEDTTSEEANNGTTSAGNGGHKESKERN